MPDDRKVIELALYRSTELRTKAELDESHLNFGGGGGNSGSMESLIDAKVAAAEARTDAKFAQVLAKLDTLTTEVRSSRSSIWTAAFAIMGLFLAVVGIVAAVAPSAFSVGAQIREVARDEARAATMNNNSVTAANSTAAESSTLPAPLPPTVAVKTQPSK